MISWRVRPAAVGLLVATLTVTSCAASATPSVSRPTASSAATVEPTVPQPHPTTAAPTLSWTVTPFPGVVRAVIEDRGSLVSVGRDADGLGSWTSTDGATWTRHDVPDPTFIEGMLGDFGPQLYSGTRMGSLTRLGDTLFSFGTFYGPNDFYRPVAWRSSDGATWEFVESDNGFYGYGTVTEAAKFGDMLLAARSIGLGGPMYSLWTWRAGVSWHASDVQSTNAAPITALDLAVVEGTAVAVGSLATQSDGPQEEWPITPVGWRSSDGLRWEALAMPDDMGRADQVAEAPAGGTSVLGSDRAGALSIWHTSDLAGWTAATRLCLEDCGHVTLARAGRWLVALSGNAQGGAIWLSSDGLSWDQEQIPAVPSPGGPVAELDGQLLVFADVGTPDDPEIVLLHAALPE